MGHHNRFTSIDDVAGPGGNVTCGGERPALDFRLTNLCLSTRESSFGADLPDLAPISTPS